MTPERSHWTHSYPDFVHIDLSVLLEMHRIFMNMHRRTGSCTVHAAVRMTPMRIEGKAEIPPPPRLR